MTPRNISSSVGVAAVALFIGLGIQYALAQWSPAPSTPPSSNASAPINVGTGLQSKAGALQLLGQGVASGTSTLDVEGVGYMSGLIVRNLQVLSGTIASGSVLTSDASGDATWQALNISTSSPSGTSCVISQMSLSGNTAYQNTTGQELMVVAYVSVTGDYNENSTINYSINGSISADGSTYTTVASNSNNSGSGLHSSTSVAGSVTFIVPPGYYYKTSGDLGNSAVVNAYQICAGSASSTHGMQVYSTPGTYTWTAPSGITGATVEIWGGGSGGTICSGNDPIDGKNAGYAKSFLSVASGNSYTIIVGAGGAGALGANTSSGDQSSFNGTQLYATGGGSLNCYNGNQGLSGTSNGTINTFPYPDPDSSYDGQNNVVQASTNVNRVFGLGGASVGGSGNTTSRAGSNGAVIIEY